MMKSEVGIVIFFALTTWVYGRSEVSFVICDTLLCIIFIVFVVGMRRAVKLILIT